MDKRETKPPASPPGRTRRQIEAMILAWPLPKPPPPPIEVSHVRILDDRLALDVSLRGSVGWGYAMTVDEWEWPRIKLARGDQWGLREVSGRHYVVSRGARRVVVLARWITRAAQGTFVSYRNGNTLDVRRSNLVVVDGAEFVTGGFGRR